MKQDITFLSDGGDDVRELQYYLNPNAEHLLDWFHVTMKITVMKLPRWIFFANQGEFLVGDYEEIMNKASCLSLVSNAIPGQYTVDTYETLLFGGFSPDRLFLQRNG